MDQDATRHGARPRPRRLCVRWGPRSLPKKGAEPPYFRPMFIAAKRRDGSRWYLSWEIGLSPGDFYVRWRPSPSPKRGRSPSPIFGPFLLWPNDWMHQDATWYGCRPQPSGLCVRWGPSPPPKFSVHVYYSYCDFVRTLHSRYWFVQVQVLVLVFYAFYFWKKKFNRTQSVPI